MTKAELFESRHPRLLRAYPADPPPWRGGDGAPELQALLRSRAQRLARLATVLAAFDIDLDPALAATDITGPADALDQWSLAHWPAVARREWAWPQPWRERDWPDDGRASVYTLIVDVGLVLGELLLRHRPQLAWAVDAYPAHEADGAASFGRAVVLDPGVALDAPAPPVCDVLDQVFMRYQSLALHDGEPGRFIDGLRPLLWGVPFGAGSR